MFKQVVALVTTVSLLFSTLCTTGPVWADKKGDEEDVQAVRTIAPRGDEGWAIVDIRRVAGSLVVVSPVIGREIDLEESNRFSLFQGVTVFNRRIDLPVLQIGVPGFQSAVFMRKANGKPAVKIQYRSGPNIESRLVNMKDDDELRRFREYVEHFNAIQKDEYTIETSSSIAEDAEYPKFTDEEVTFEMRRPLFALRTRMRTQLVLKDGEKIRGEAVPVYEDEQILVETDLDIRRISVAEIDRIRFLGEKGAAAMEKAVLSGIGGIATGAFVGAFAAWQADADVKQTAIFAALIFGTAGFITGLLTGAKSTRGSVEYVMGPVEDGKKKKRDKGRD